MSTNFPNLPYDQQRHYDGTNIWTWYEVEQTWKIEEEFILNIPYPLSTEVI